MSITVQLLLNSIMQMVATILWLRTSRHAGCRTCLTPAHCIRPLTFAQLGGWQLTADAVNSKNGLHAPIIVTCHFALTMSAVAVQPAQMHF